MVEGGTRTRRLGYGAVALSADGRATRRSAARAWGIAPKASGQERDPDARAGDERSCPGRGAGAVPARRVRFRQRVPSPRPTSHQAAGKMIPASASLRRSPTRNG